MALTWTDINGKTRDFIVPVLVDTVNCRRCINVR